MGYGYILRRLHLSRTTIYAFKNSESIKIMSYSINMWMFSYQRSMRLSLEYRVEETLKALQLEVLPRALLVGIKAPGTDARHPVCIEPEDGEWSVDLFTHALEQVEQTFRDHPSQNLFYGDDASMRDKPENIRRASVREVVEKNLSSIDQDLSRRSFFGQAVRVNDYYVVPVVQVPEWLFLRFPPLKQEATDDSRKPRGTPSFIHACIYEVLKDVYTELRLPDPGRFSATSLRPSVDIVRSAAEWFMHTPIYMVSQQWDPANLFNNLNYVSSLLYEGVKGVGNLVLTDSENPQLKYLVRFQKPIPFKAGRWARKVLQMASSEVSLITDGKMIFGLGTHNESEGSDGHDTFIVEFLDHYHWQIRHHGNALLQCEFGVAKLPQEIIGRERFMDNFARVFPMSNQAAGEDLWRVFSSAVNLGHGSMIVVATDAQSEAERLSSQGTQILPAKLTVELFERVSGIDGTVLVDQFGICHAVGVILDGLANDQCTPSRGSRYNSAVRYIVGSAEARMAIVVSDDKMVDLTPLLRPQIDRQEVEYNVSKLESATQDNFYKPRNWLNDNRFYLTADQCSRVNIAIARIDEMMSGTRYIRIVLPTFIQDPGMNDGYYLPESTQPISGE